MDMTPAQVRGATFRTVRKGYDPDEVDAFLERAAQALEEALQQATAMEARARAAVARLQELTAANDAAAAERASAAQAGGDAAPPPSEPQPAAEPASPVGSSDPATSTAPAPVADVIHVSADEVETISRTLLLAQRTADTTIAEARAEAERIRTEARGESDATLDSAREMSAQLLDAARAEARTVSEQERVAAANEVQSLVARREFLVGDVDQLERFLIDQRDRLRAAARQIEAVCDRVPAGLGQVRPPALSASNDPPGDDTAEHFRPSAEVLAEFDIDDLEPTAPFSWSGEPEGSPETSPGATDGHDRESPTA